MLGSPFNGKGVGLHVPLKGHTSGTFGQASQCYFIFKSAWHSIVEPVEDAWNNWKGQN